MFLQSIEINEKKIDRTFIQNILTQLIQIPSINPPINEGEKKAALFLIEKMKELGLETIYDEVAQGRANAVGIFKGKGTGPTLILNGHLDVVPVDRKLWNSDPFNPIIEDGKMYGRGAADMKGALASMLGAVKYVIDNNISLKGNVILSFVCDEEKSNLGVINFLKKGIKADYAIIGEPTNLDIAIASRGISVFKITTKGISGHSSKPRNSLNAIYQMSKVLKKIQDYCESLENRKHDLLPSPTAAVTIIKGGDKENIIPDKCDIVVDRRLLPGETEKTALSELSTLMEEIKRDDDKFDYSIERLEKPFTLPGELKPTNDFIKHISDVYKNYFNVKEVPLVGFQASCEQPFFLNEGIETIVFGPGSISQAHVVNEYVEIEQLFQAAGFYAACILSFNIF